jgi:tetratricopeptide (TPR) repeat protein
VGLTAVVFFWRRKHPYLLTGWLWPVGMLVPVCGLVQVSPHWQADHYNYLPQIGLALALTWSVAEWTQSWRYRCLMVSGLAVTVLGALSFMAARQTATWRNDLTLWTHALAYYPDNPVAHNNLGVALFQQGRKEEAEAHYRAALKLKPDFGEAHNNLGVTLFAQARYEEAVREYDEALLRQPHYARAHANLGNALRQLGRQEEAELHYREAFRLKPGLANHYPEMK